ncbi:hypothetical protein [Mesobacillus foraminis]|jgi:hypothetical protein|uniref:Uncharacterized protein n=1 Tax=Mesobacillus foraminis TaxID=279826 RepID=A0A4R2BEH1_9BACI|nr:hypothetical protein [Mesobacillus foraminis]TCN24873.1 hypothetical protein EV146_10672 [Mesobacillus foraminis]
MKRKNKWTTSIIIFGMMAILFGAYYGYTALNFGQGKSATGGGSEAGASEQVAQFKDGESNKGYKNVGVFIADFHEKYNKSLGWGGIDSVKWTDQKKIAGDILALMASVQTDNKALQTDFESISTYAKQVESGAKDKQILLKLHRYFHDLDVEFNRYKDTKDYYDVTEYKS